jgi:hypothetical protein
MTLAARRGLGTAAKAAAKLLGETDNGLRTAVDAITGSFAVDEPVVHRHPRNGAGSLRPSTGA